MERVVDDKTIMGGEWGFIKKGISSGLNWSQISAKTQKSLRCESKKPPPPNQAKRKNPKSNIQF